MHIVNCLVEYKIRGGPARGQVDIALHKADMSAVKAIWLPREQPARFQAKMMFARCKAPFLPAAALAPVFSDKFPIHAGC